MLKVRSLVGVAAALIATPLMGLPAWGAACSSFITMGNLIPIATATASGFSCEVNQLTFSNIQVNNSGGPLFGFFVYNQNGESGLTLNYANTSVGGVVTDAAWLMTVTAAPGVLINDVFAQLTGSVTALATGLPPGPAGQHAFLSEDVLQLGTSNVVAHIDLSLPAPPGLSADTKFFTTPVSGVSVFKNQQNVSVPDGLIVTSLLTNAFSVVPGPIAGAGLPGLVVAALGLVGLGRRRRQQA